MRYLSVCSGIESVSVAWQPLGWQPAMFAEIDPFCCWLLRSRYRASRPVYMPSPHSAPDQKDAKRRAAAIRNIVALPADGEIVNAGDFTRIGANDVGTIDLLAGGTFLASLSPSPVSERDWMTRVAISPSSLLDLLADSGPYGWCGRTFPVSSRLTTGGHLEPSSGCWSNSGMGSPTEFWTLNLPEYPSDGAASSLSDILETGELPQRYYLSGRACRGILRRAAKRGKMLPPPLAHALMAVAGQEQTSTSMGV